MANRGKPAAALSGGWQRGFTLIELMAVILIVGLMAGVATVAIFTNTDYQKIERAAKQLQAKVELITEEAQLQGVDLGLLLLQDDEDNWLYRWYRLLDEDERGDSDDPVDWWSRLTSHHDPMFASTRLPPSIELELQLESGELVRFRSEREEELPQIFFYRNGEISPFQLQLINADGDIHYELQADMLGRVTVVDALSEDLE